MAFMSNRAPLEKDQPLRFRRRLVLILSGLAVAAFARLLDSAPGLVDAVYSEAIGPWISLGLGRISGLAPFSLVELAVGVIVLRYGLATAVCVFDVGRGKRRLSNALGCGLLRSLTAAALVVVFFYASWGFSYSRPGMMVRFGWQEVLSSDDDLAEELGAMCEGLVRAANDEYERAFGSTDTGAASRLPMTMAELDAAVEEGYGRLALEFELEPHFALARGRIKPVAASELLSRLLILGFYSPWTGEAHYNTRMVDCELPQIVAHEKAHQRCITSEDEANFFGTLACALSDEPYVRYSGFLAAQRQLLTSLHELNPQRAKDIMGKRHPGVRRDKEACRDFVLKYLGTLSAVGSAVNDTYLKANGVQEGILSYNMDTQLLIAFTRARGAGWYEGADGGVGPPLDPTWDDAPHIWEQTTWITWNVRDSEIGAGAVAAAAT